MFHYQLLSCSLLFFASLGKNFNGEDLQVLTHCSSISRGGRTDPKKIIHYTCTDFSIPPQKILYNLLKWSLTLYFTKISSSMHPFSYCSPVF